jgi:hypothetical protein
MLAGPWWSERVDTQHPVDAVVAVRVADRAWSCDLRQRSVTVSDGADAAAAATVQGEPEHVFLWLWGREPDSAVQTSGDAPILAEFRARLAECLG